jgi:hypothetical protein
MYVALTGCKVFKSIDILLYKEMKECLIMKNFVFEGKIFIGMTARRCKILSIQPENLRPN